MPEPSMGGDCQDTDKLSIIPLTNYLSTVLNVVVKDDTALCDDQGNIGDDQPDGTDLRRIGRKTYYVCDLGSRGRGKLAQTQLSKYFKTTCE